MKVIYDNKQAKKENKAFGGAKLPVANLGGYTLVDDFIGVSEFPLITLAVNKKGVKLTMKSREKTGKGIFGKVEKKEMTIVLDWEDINFIEYAYDDDEKEKYKNKSVVGRALIGGVLTGGIGVVVGGMSGVGQKKKNSKFELEALYAINFKDEQGAQQEINLLSRLESKDKTMVNLYNNNRNLFGLSSPPDKFLSSRVVESRGLRPLTENSSSATSALDEVKKLKELLDIGAITLEEFEIKKKELLNL